MGRWGRCSKGEVEHLPSGPIRFQFLFFRGSLEDESCNVIGYSVYFVAPVLHPIFWVSEIVHDAKCNKRIVIHVCDLIHVTCHNLHFSHRNLRLNDQKSWEMTNHIAVHDPHIFRFLLFCILFRCYPIVTNLPVYRGLMMNYRGHVMLHNLPYLSLDDLYV